MHNYGTKLCSCCSPGPSPDHCRSPAKSVRYFLSSGVDTRITQFEADKFEEGMESDGPDLIGEFVVRGTEQVAEFLRRAQSEGSELSTA